ncbi:MAG TPA: hypothetical protein VF763_11020 [Candidatus Limnocylindrales bacterium]
MGTRDRPHREVKKKAKDSGQKPKLQPLLEPPVNVELIKPKRKPRLEEPEES